VGSPAIDGGRGLKHGGCLRYAVAFAWIARHRWRARIETRWARRSSIGSAGSPAIDGGRGLKPIQRSMTALELAWIARHRWRARIETSRLVALSLSLWDRPPSMAGAD